jgi:NodT family efflux transporter outer membrane factor (OMF) lipoprotein
MRDIRLSATLPKKVEMLFPLQKPRAFRKPENRRSVKPTTSQVGFTVRRLCALGLFCLTSCTVGPNFVPPKAPLVDRYTAGAEPTTTISANGQAQRFEKGADVVSEWWRLFSSSKLDRVMKEAISHNATLQAGQASLRQSQENLRAGFGVFYPEVNGSFNATREKFSPASIGQGGEGNVFSLYTLTATISYALDVFGGERRAVESLRSQVDFQRYTMLATYLTLSGNVVNAVVAGAAYRALIEATEEMISLEKEQIRITEIQAQAGTVPYANVLSIQTQLSATEATLPPLRQKLSQTDHLLATLAGRLPSEWAPLQVGLADLKLPSDLPVTLPSKLVRRRPDILAAEAQLHVASAEIGVATAALLPGFTLNGSYGLSSNSSQDLFKSTSNVWSLGAGLSAPLFHGGTLWHERQAAMEGYQQSLANYHQTVLGAFAQVADVLRALESDAEALQAQSQALDTAEKALRLVQANYRAGLANYLQVLNADAQYYQSKIAYAQALALRFQDTVALYIALGGGWWNIPPTPDNFLMTPNSYHQK